MKIRRLISKANTEVWNSGNGGCYNNCRDEYERDNADGFGRYSREKTDRIYCQVECGEKGKEEFKSFAEAEEEQPLKPPTFRATAEEDIRLERTDRKAKGRQLLEQRFSKCGPLNARGRGPFREGVREFTTVTIILRYHVPLSPWWHLLTVQEHWWMKLLAP